MNVDDLENLIIECRLSNQRYREFVSRLALLTLMWWIWTFLITIME